MSRLAPERWRALSPHLDRVLELPPAERAAALAELAGADPALAEELETLLVEHAALEAEGFLADGPLPGRRGEPSLAGLVVGAYTLRAPLGQGGMGSVWLAERTDGRFTGKAAVKLLNASLVGRDGQARFEREGSVLARLRHPHIAHLIDAGVSPLGQPYLVLEYVDGEPLDAYCERRGLDVEARLRLFGDVLAAVAFAHANLVVHRDLKPANILVRRDGEVKLLDFGIAKLLEGDGGAPTLTREGESALTPRFAAPEQLTGGAITTATDVYALGVVLYLLLTNRHPAGASTSSIAEWIKAVVEAPPRRASEVAPSPRLARRLQGDLDNILARALEKKAQNRYASVEQFAEDLRRHLADQPVSARGDAAAYRAFKFVRRHRAGVAAAGLVAAALLAGLAGTAWQAREARRQRDAAERQLVRANATNEFTAFLLSVGAPAGRPFTVTELLEQGESLIDKQFADDDAMRAELLVTLGRQYIFSERWDKATPVFERANALAERSPDPALRARVFCPLAVATILNGDQSRAEATIRRALADLPSGREHDVQRAECLTRKAEFGFFTGDGAATIADASAALEMLERSPLATRLMKIDARAALAFGYHLARRSADADRTFAEVMAELEASGRERTIAAVDTLNNWSLVHYLGELRKAEPLLRRAIALREAIEGPAGVTPTNTFNLAGVLLQLGRLEEAEELLARTVRTAEARQEFRILFDALMETIGCYVAQGRLDDAARQIERVRAFVGHPRFDQLRLPQWRYYQGLYAEARGDAAAAAEHYAAAVADFDTFEQKLAMNVSALTGLARAERARGRAAAARAAADRAVALAESLVEPGAPSYLVGLALETQGDLERAAGGTGRQALGAAAGHLETALGADHAATRRVRAKLS